MHVRTLALDFPSATNIGSVISLCIWTKPSAAEIYETQVPCTEYSAVEHQSWSLSLKPPFASQHQTTPGDRYAVVFAHLWLCATHWVGKIIIFLHTVYCPTAVTPITSEAGKPAGSC